MHKWPAKGQRVPSNGSQRLKPECNGENVRNAMIYYDDM